MAFYTFRDQDAKNHTINSEQIQRVEENAGGDYRIIHLRRGSSGIEEMLTMESWADLTAAFSSTTVNGYSS